MLRRPVEPGQYTSIRYAHRLEDAGALASIGTVGDSYDNAQVESLIASGALATTNTWREPSAMEIRDALPKTMIGKLSKKELVEEERKKYEARKGKAAG